MQTPIDELGDELAIRVLSVFASAKLEHGNFETELAIDLRQVIENEIATSDVNNLETSEGDLARQALTLLSRDPEYAETIQALIEGPQARDFTGVETVVITTAVMIVLQTQVKFERDKEGKWSLSIEKKPTSDALLKPLVQKFLGFLDSGA